MQLPTPGDVFKERYRIEDELGAGGFSRVYLARDTRSERRVALKLVIPDGEEYSREMRARFGREVRIIANLGHPNTVTLLDCSTSDDDQLFMVFEHLPGRDLADLLGREEGLSVADSRRVLMQVLGALHEAHSQGLIHRDIKPENIRVHSAPGAPIEVKLLDFGIARSTDDGHPSLTKTGELIGTPRYMSPEQLTERPLTPRSDIYSLGMVAFEMLGGRDRLPGGSWTDQLDRLRDDHTFDTARPGVDPHLSKVIGRMTARDPEARYPSAAAALAALERPDVDPLEARTTRKLLRPTAAREKPPTSWVIAGVSAAILLAFLFVFASSNPDEPPVVSPPAQRSALHSIIAANDEPAPVADAAAPAIDAAPDVGPTLPPYASAGCAKPARVLPEIVRLPADSDPQTPLPAIVWLHAHNEPATNIPDSKPFQTLIEREQVAVVLPTASGHVWGQNEMERLTRIVREVGDVICLDERRIYVASSAGAGVLSSRLACEPWVAGVAISSYVELEGDEFDCPTPRPTLWIVTRDSVHQPMAGGKGCVGGVKLPWTDTQKKLRRRHQCRAPTTTLETSSATCRRWQCEVPFEECTVVGGLGWPGGPRPAIAALAERLNICPEPGVTADFDATTHAWSFFASLPYNESTQPE